MIKITEAKKSFHSQINCARVVDVVDVVAVVPAAVVTSWGSLFPILTFGLFCCSSGLLFFQFY